ncbi:MAG: permease [Peptococcaceae bacterium]
MVKLSDNKMENAAIYLLNIIIIGLFLDIMINFDWEAFSFIPQEYLAGFTIVFLSIILEALPFIMIGTFISAIIQIFVSEETIAGIIPRSRFTGLLAAALAGILFPVCECAIIPVTRRLIQKGVPLHIAVTFMLAVPIVNPVVLASTYYAFSGQAYMMLFRGSLGLVGAVLIGYLTGVMEKAHNPLKNGSLHLHNQPGDSCSAEDGCQADRDFAQHSCGCNHCAGPANPGARGFAAKITALIEHAGSELYDVGRFLIIGAFLSALMQTFIDRSYFLAIGQGQVSSTVVMMILAFGLSLCSEADAFVARTFVGQFTTGSIIGFLIFGPMLDMKNTLLLLGTFKIKFVMKLITVIALTCFIMAMLVNVIGG